MDKAYIVVGHARWGKSQTLAEFTNHDRRSRHMQFFGRDFFVRRISNDDNESALIRFVENSIQDGGPVWGNYLLMTFCPTFEKKRKPQAIHILETLCDVYQLYFFVLQESYDRERIITDLEIEALRRYGFVDILSGHHEAAIRARSLRRFIRENL
jgi:hypothetical protein